MKTESALIDLTPDERRRRVEAFLAEHSGESAVSVTGVRRLAGGSSRQVWSFDATLGRGRRAFRLEGVLRLDPVPPGARTLPEAAAGFQREFDLLAALHRRDVPVPRVLWSCTDPAILGGPFYVMERLTGETIARRILRSSELAKAREKLPAQLGRALARIHAVDLEAEGLAGHFSRAGASAVASQLAQLRAGLKLAPAPLPTLELAYRWLEQNPPPAHEQTLVHGDYRMGNVVVGPDGLRAVLDWELAHVGDPHEDLAWMCAKAWRFGVVDAPVGGVGPREPFYQAYEEESARRIDRAALRYWDLLAAARVAVVWIFQVHSYLSGARPGVEQAAIGRRIAEADLDLLELLEQL